MGKGGLYRSVDNKIFLEFLFFPFSLDELILEFGIKIIFRKVCINFNDRTQIDFIKLFRLEPRDSKSCLG